MRSCYRWNCNVMMIIIEPGDVYPSKMMDWQRYDNRRHYQ